MNALGRDGLAIYDGLPHTKDDYDGAWTFRPIDHGLNTKATGVLSSESVEHAQRIWSETESGQIQISRNLISMSSLVWNWIRANYEEA